MKIAIVILSIIPLLVFNSCEEDQVLEKNLDRRIERELELDGVPSLMAGIVQDDKLVWSKGYGFQDLESQDVPNEETVYLLASISKTIVAVAIMQLYEEGKLDLWADVNNYLPFEATNPRYPDHPINTWMLLTHTSSLAWPENFEDPRYNDRFPEGEAQSLGEWVSKYLVPGESLYRETTWRNTIPGEVYQYSNIGVALLGYMVEVISGQDFAAYCQENIFEPLEMTNSGYFLKDLEDQSKLATLYHDSRTIDQYSIPSYPSAMVRSSVEELSHFLIAIMNGGMYKNTRILKESTVDVMLSPKIRRGTAFLWQPMDDGWIGHTGGYWGVSSSMDFHRTEKIGVILLTNAHDGETVYPGGEVYELLHELARKDLN